jgi:signal transduction histidine kinase/CheY-like chemotaxis protein
MQSARDARPADEPRAEPSASAGGSPNESVDAGRSPQPGTLQEINDQLISRVARLEAALTLTAGTVHDVNNVLTVLAGNLFLLTESARGQEKLYEQARRARNAAERGSTLLRELLTFDRDGDSEPKAICPDNHVFALQPLLARAIGADKELAISVDRKAGSVIASAAQFESVLINLVINARDALNESGKVTIRVRDARIDFDQAVALQLVPGDYVCVSVSDNGHGIPEEILHRVTEPLFSTKPADQGSGLGLAMVKRFAEQAGGALQIESQVGKGTTMTIWLPRTNLLAETTANMTLPLSTLPGGDERLLLVSRDRDVRIAMQQILETLGYSVSVAENLEGVDRLRPGATPLSLVISERSAAAVRTEQRWLDSLRESNATLKHIALLQGGTDATLEAPDADGYVYRPVTIAELARTVRKVLEKK